MEDEKSVSGALDGIKEFLAGVKETWQNREDRSTADWDRLAKELEGKISDWTKAQAAEVYQVPSGGGRIDAKAIYEHHGLGIKSFPCGNASEGSRAKDVMIDVVFDRDPAKALSLLDNKKRHNDIYRSPIKRWTGHGWEYEQESDDLKRIQLVHDDLYMLHSMMRVAGPSWYREDPRKGIRQLALWREWMELTKDFRGMQKAETILEPTVAGAGDEWVPTGFSQQIFDAISAQLRVASIFPQFAQPTNPFTWPQTTLRPYAWAPGDATAATDDIQQQGDISAGRTVTAARFVAHQDFAEELDEDASFAFMPFLRSKLMEALARADEMVIISGDGDGTHQDFDVEGGSAEDPRKAYDGLRKFGSAHTQPGGAPATYTLALLNATRTVLGAHYGTNPSDLAIITGAGGFFNNLMDITEVRTLEQFGPNAFILTGQIAMIAGSPVIISSEFPENLHTTGYNTNGGANNTTGLLYVHRPAFLVTTRRGSRVDTDFNVKSSVRTMAATWRRGFLDLADTTSGGANESSVAYQINLTP